MEKTHKANGIFMNSSKERELYRRKRKKKRYKIVGSQQTMRTENHLHSLKPQVGSTLEWRRRERPRAVGPLQKSVEINAVLPAASLPAICVVKADEKKREKN